MARKRADRIADMRRLARLLRSHAADASYAFYAEQMNQAAHELELYADTMEARRIGGEGPGSPGSPGLSD